MTTLGKIDPVAITTLRNDRMKATAATQSRQEIAASGKSVPVTNSAAVNSQERKKEIDRAVKNVSGYVQNVTRELNFTIDEELDKFIVTVLDQDTGEIIRQIPTEEMLELARTFADVQDNASRDGYKGILFRGSA